MGKFLSILLAKTIFSASVLQYVLPLILSVVVIGLCSLLPYLLFRRKDSGFSKTAIWACAVGGFLGNALTIAGVSATSESSTVTTLVAGVFGAVLVALPLAIIFTIVGFFKRPGPDESFQMPEIVYRNEAGAEPSPSPEELAALAATDKKSAFMAWLSGANSGDARCQFQIGLLYENGVGRPKNENIAHQWYQRAASQDNAEAQLRLGQMYLKGVGVEKHVGLGRFWLAEAAAQGNAEASNSIAQQERNSGVRSIVVGVASAIAATFLIIVLTGVAYYSLSGKVDSASTDRATDSENLVPSRARLSQARQRFKTQIAFKPDGGVPAPTPPAEIFAKVDYSSPAGLLSAYVSPDPKSGEKRPAIIWITGGDSNTLGDVWSPAPRSNDQTASAFRAAGIVMMFPSLRGGNDSPAAKEYFYGEVDDILAAADYLSTLSYVDPQHIYLGGHSTGGTLALLTAESSARFRRVFSFGPVADITHYGRQLIPMDFSQYDRREAALRSPGRWLAAISSPVLVIEGEGGNSASLEQMKKLTKNPMVRFLKVQGADHFSVLAPATELIAREIGHEFRGLPFNVSEQELSASFAGQPITQHGGTDREGDPEPNALVDGQAPAPNLSPEEQVELAQRVESARQANCARQSGMAPATGAHNLGSKPTGPTRALAVDACGTLFVSAANGLFRFRKGAWTHASIPQSANGPLKPAQGVSTLAVDVDNTLYAGTSGAGLFKSADGGQSWSEANQGLGNGSIYVYTLVFGPRNTMYAGTYAGLYVRRGDEAWRAIDTGKDMTYRTGQKYSVHSLVIARDGSLFAGTPHGIFKSQRGSPWVVSSTDAHSMYAMAIDSKGTLYAAGEAGVFENSDGQLWNHSSGWVVAKALVIDADDSVFVGGTGVKNLEGGVFSTFGVLSQKSPGGDWTPINATLNDRQGNSQSVMALAVDRDGMLTAGAYAGVFQRPKGKQTWQQLTD